MTRRPRYRFVDDEPPPLLTSPLYPNPEARPFYFDEAFLAFVATFCLAISYLQW